MCLLLYTCMWFGVSSSPHFWNLPSPNWWRSIICGGGFPSFPSPSRHHFQYVVSLEEEEETGTTRVDDYPKCVMLIGSRDQPSTIHPFLRSRKNHFCTLFPLKVLLPFRRDCDTLARKWEITEEKKTASERASFTEGLLGRGAS